MATDNVPTEGGAPTTRTRVQDGGLWFQTVTTTKHGSRLSCNDFDVPPEEYGEGNETGIRVAKDLLASLQAYQGPACCSPAFSVIAAAFGAYLEGGHGSERDRRGAAVGFLRTIEEMVIFAAEHCDHQPWLETKLAKMRASRTQADERMRLERCQRMEKARAAKRLKRLAAAARGDAALQAFLSHVNEAS